MKLEIVTPTQIIFSGEVNTVTVPGTKGRFTILANHAPIISSLSKGNIVYQLDDKDYQIGISSGFVEVNNNEISIVIDSTDE